jgi:hypothetical protein
MGELTVNAFLDGEQKFVRRRRSRGVVVWSLEGDSRFSKKRMLQPNVP